MFEKVNFMLYSPDKLKEIAVEVNTIITVSQIIEELIKNEFVPADYSYGLLIEDDGRILSSHSTLSCVRNNACVRVVVFSENQFVNGKKINVTFLHPSERMDMEVEINDGLTVEEIIDELIACNFISDNDEKRNYKIFVKNSQTEISGKQTIASGGTIDGSVLRVII